MSSKKVLMTIGDYCEDWETSTSCAIAKFCGFTVDTCCPNMKQGQMCQAVCHEADMSEKPGHMIPITCDFDSCNPANYAGLILPGGRAPEQLRLNNHVLDMVRTFAQQKKPIAASCHGPQILMTAGCLNGVNCTCFAGIAPDVKMAGANYNDMMKDQYNACADEQRRVYTCATAHGVPMMMRAFCKCMGCEVKCQQ